MWPFKKRSKTETAPVVNHETPAETANGGVYASVISFAPVEAGFQQAFDDMDDHIKTLRTIREKLETKKKRSHA
jgi:hypothetical protein